MIAVADRSKEAIEFGKRLRSLRESKKLTQAQLGELAGGMPYQNIARFERGDRSPSWEVLLRLANALGAKLDDFRTGDSALPSEPESPAEDEPAPEPSPRPRSPDKGK